MAKSLLPLGGVTFVGRAACPLFARPDAMLFQMRQLEAHCRALWMWCLAQPGAGWQDVFLLDYLPTLGPGRQPLRLFQRLPHRRVQRDQQGAGGTGAGRAAPWPCVHDTGPQLLPPACSGAPSTAAGEHMKGTAWTRRKRTWRREQCGRGCSRCRRRGPAPRQHIRPLGACQVRASAPTRDLPH